MHRENKNTKLSFRSQDLILDLKYEQTCPAGRKRHKSLSQDSVWDLKHKQMQREKEHQIMLQVSRSCLRSQTWTKAERKRTPNYASGLKILFEISNMNKGREKKDTKLSFRSQDPVRYLKHEQMQREKRHQIKLQVSRSHLRSQIWTCAKRKRHQIKLQVSRSHLRSEIRTTFRSQDLIWDLKYEQMQREKKRHKRFRSQDLI